jgi:hypothetical protein
MTRRTLLLSILFGIAGVAAFLFNQRASEDGPVASPAPVLSTHLAKVYTRMRTAEQLSDRAQRCLTYPDPPWIHWNRNVVEAFCTSRAFNYVSLDAIRAALETGDIDAVETAFAAYLDENYSSPSRHGILTRVYRELFRSDSEEVRTVVERWVALAPRSPFAHAARGMHFFAVAETARGGNFVRDTPEENFSAMHRFAAQAEADLREASKLQPKLTPTYDAMILVGRLTGNRELVDFALGAAREADPTDERLYLDWMAVSEPRWGGSLRAMASVAEKADRLVPQNPLMKLPAEKERAYYGDMALLNHEYA